MISDSRLASRTPSAEAPGFSRLGHLSRQEHPLLKRRGSHGSGISLLKNTIR